MSKLKEYKEISIEEIKEVDEFRTFIPENNMYDKIKEDIAKNGIKVPLIVNQNYELINGYTRLKIAKELGIKKVPVAVYETTDRADEYDLLVSTNLTQRQLSKAQALALIEKAVEEKTKILKKNQNSENNPKETKVERVPVQLSESQNKKIQSLTDLRNAVKEELKKYNVKVDDRALDYYIRIKENAPWLTDYILKGKLGIYPAYSIYTKLQEMGLLEAVAKLPPYERNTLLTDGRKIILDERKDLLEEIVNHRMAVSQAINKLKTEEKLKKAKGSKPRAKDEEEDEGEEIETIDREDSESDEEYDLVGEWKKAEEEEKEKQLTPQLNGQLLVKQEVAEDKVQTDFLNELRTKGFAELPFEVALVKIEGKCYVINVGALHDLEQGVEKWKELADFLSKHDIIIPGEAEGLYVIPWKLLGRCSEWK
ncbi:chromosome partitioning protein ParB [Saccharolobus solfataricus]|uniref:Chromosome partitioning protein ParB n=2 Tax=Saccharolobus solfataricus TaxID=2287 RepID=A0A0E3JU18_SACSO|nr:ParB N-terminal domain-containing protein [Saccharolobus solfataricus]AKA73835.1 chromosome partitioning protein ParB [Saccharolobus solfataricus]AKA76533.1 chromosome partitioning protein ParB [Saccharolobus solfataricus]AKA79226.1 chromosome partitioning protein ParB [Saccharolobus solfataricus]AZF68315.1 chromosome partitioning protein ParB [Saccharolobus solfataricus]AZF70935.1 chromosome partitioning protein ParB [Saccharolobus solfataricus]